MDFHNDDRIVLTLDAGGTNFSFAAMQAGKRIAGPVTLPAEAQDLDRSLANLFAGFEQVATEAGGKVAAISFAFPGPADYVQGVLYNVGNLPAYAGGVPLADILQKRFGVPVYINNDGDLFAYGEAVGGLLPEVNARLEAAGSLRRYRNLIGLTLGTGLGGGLVINGQLLQGDNSLSGEVWLLRHGFQPGVNAEEGASIRAITQAYATAASGDAATSLTPRDISQIANGEMEGDATAARHAFAQLGRTVGDVIANVVTLIDGLVVLGGGLSNAHELFMPSLLEVVNGPFSDAEGAPDRLVQQVYNLESDADASTFYASDLSVGQAGSTTEIAPYVPQTAVGVSRLGANKAVSLGAYAVAIQAT